jgi:hypothetical protein
MAESTPSVPASNLDSSSMSSPAASPKSSPRLPRTRTDSDPVPTDSMVTIRLSDNQSAGAQEKFSIDTAIANNEKVIEVDTWDPSATTSPVAESCQSPVETLCSGSPSTPRSRSNSNASGSPTTSTSVDWEGLEKTEEQEPRDEGTDDVNHLLSSPRPSLTSIVDCTITCSTRTGKQRPRNKPQIWNLKTSP